VVPAGRDARPSRANVRHPAAAQLLTAQPFVLDGLPGTTPRRPRSVAGMGRAFGACCFAGKLRSPAGPAPDGRGQGSSPLRHSLRQPLRHSLRAGGAYPWLRWPSASVLVSPLRGASQPQKPRLTGPPRGSGAAQAEWMRFARLIHRPVRVLGGPAVRAAFGGSPSLPYLLLTVVVYEYRVLHCFGSRSHQRMARRGAHAGQHARLGLPPLADPRRLATSPNLTGLV
jgi:hypothetical protein